MFFWILSNKRELIPVTHLLGEINMESMASLFLLYIGSFLVLMANLIGYRTKFIIYKQGYDVSWMSRNLDDYPNLLKAIEIETNETEESHEIHAHLDGGT